MDNNQGPCETNLGGGAVERQVSQTNNLKEETVVMPEQLEKKNIDVDDLPSEDLVGKVQVNSSEVEVDVNTASENHETKSNGHSNGYMNGVSGSDSEAEIDGSDSEIEDKETGLNSLDNIPNDNAGKTESDDNLAADIVLTSNSVVESDTNELQSEETMGPNNEAADNVACDIDLDKSVPELVTEYELLSQGTTMMSQSVMQSESSFFSSMSSSTSSSSVKTSRIPVAVDKKKSSIITRQNTYTVESSSSGEEISSSEPTKDISITEVNNMEDEIDASVGSLLQRQNTYTVKTSTVHASQKVSQEFKSLSSQEFKSFSVDENVSSISEGNLQLHLQEEKSKIDDDVDTSNEISESDFGKPKAEEVHVTEEESKLEAVLDNSQIVTEVPEQICETPSEKEAIAEALTSIEKPDEHLAIIEEQFSEIIIQKLEAQNIIEPTDSLSNEQKDTTENILQEEKPEGNVSEPKGADIHVAEVSEKVAVLDNVQNPNEEAPQHIFETPSEIEMTAEVAMKEKSEEHIPIVEEVEFVTSQIVNEVPEPIFETPSKEETISEALTSVENLDEHALIVEAPIAAQRIIDNTDSLFKEPEETLEHNLQEADVETTEEIFEGSVGKPKPEDGHVPEEASDTLALLETAQDLNKETPQHIFEEKEIIVENLTAVGKKYEKKTTVEEVEVVLVTSQIVNEVPEPIFETPSEEETITEALTSVEKPDEHTPIVEAPIGAQSIIDNTDSLFKEPEETLEPNLQDADIETTEEIFEGSVGKPKPEDGHVPEEASETLAVLETAQDLNEETPQRIFEEKEIILENLTAVEKTDEKMTTVEEVEVVLVTSQIVNEVPEQIVETPSKKEMIAETLTSVEKPDQHVPIVEEQVSEILIPTPEEHKKTEDVEPLYKDPEDALEPGDTQYKPSANEVQIAKVEDQYVTAEEVRIQKHKVVVKDEIFPEDIVIAQSIPIISVENQDLTKEPTILEETSLLSSHIPLIVPLVSIPVRSAVTEDEETDPDKSVDNENIRTSKDVEQLLRDISDPNLDCSLEDIEAMIEGKELVPPKEELNRVSPEFATAATLIDQNPDKGFDPEDPAVKGIEDWECSNLNTSLESVESRSSKLKNVFKRRRSRSEERKSLLDEKSNGNNNEEEDEEEKVSMGCINSWLLYIFIKIVD